MIRKFFITILFLFLCFVQANAHIDIVYPTTKDLTVNSDITFISGNTDKNSVLKINSEKVKLWDDGFFVHVVPLDYGLNKIKIESHSANVIEKELIKIRRNRPNKSSKKYEPPKYIKNEECVLYAKVLNDRATIRSSSSKYSKRIIDVQKGIVLYLDGKQGEYYKIQEQGDTELWIHKSNITEPVKLSGRIQAKIKKQQQFSDELYDYQKFYLTYPVIYSVEQKDNKIKLTMYGVKDDNAPLNLNYEYNYEFDTPVLGYEFYYEENTLVFKKAKFPENINDDKPLAGINIFIDAGHGGDEKGTIGPSRVLEKDVNLDISNKLIKLLQNAGANVSYSRIDDKKVELYDRIELAKQNNALISLSIHCNSLPYGKNPYLKHGTEAHYYNENAKFLSELIKFNLANDLNIKDNGIHNSSFALTRSSNPVCVLVEVAYMINPEEYILLKNEVFRKNVAKSIKKSLEEYILYLKNKKI